MSATHFTTRWELHTVEPVRRMVGGHFGFAYHRFPIKGGITPAQASRVLWKESFAAAMSKPSYFAGMLGTDRAAGRGRPLRYYEQQESA